MERTTGTLLALLVTGCREEPARIEVKGPAPPLGAAHGIAELPVFEHENDTIRLRVAALDDRGRYMGSAEARWKSLDPSVASVDQTGLVTILSSGKTKIVATTSETERPLEGDIEIEAVILDDIEITKPERVDGRLPKLPLGERLQFEAVVRNDRGEVVEDARVRWESTTWAATIGVNGEAEGRAIRRTAIIAYAANGATARIELEVTDWPKGPRRPR